jgi:hypothetical protein
LTVDQGRLFPGGRDGGELGELGEGVKGVELLTRRGSNIFKFKFKFTFTFTFTFTGAVASWLGLERPLVQLLNYLRPSATTPRPEGTRHPALGAGRGGWWSLRAPQTLHVSADGRGRAR